MALSTAGHWRFHGTTLQTVPEVSHMQKILPIFLALFATMFVLGIVLVITRTGATWPRSIRTLDWRRLTGTTQDDETVPVEAPAE
jgi:hypothetical protein